ncbi:MAG TPA: iron-containing alcohol dehydrogenase [Spirochaetota bacterium]|nr:iron-containing alcohol dehydrogenase [Spirochaetota bacterium]
MILPGYYEYCCRVKTVAGHRALEKISPELARMNAKKPMVITDKGVAGAGLIKLVTSAIKSARGAKVSVGAVYDNVPPDSDLKMVQEVAKLYRAKNCDSIIAVGGGSVLDTAKGVNILVSLGGDSLMRYAGAGAVKKKLRPMIAVPTTSGTGSEMTLVAVIADHERSVKLPFVSYFLLPDVAVLDSRMTKTLPPALTASTGMDAMTHACEAYTCMAKNPVSDSNAMEAIRLIAENILNVVKKPNDMEGRLALANASALAGMAFSNSMVGMVHMLGHATGGACGVPHGTCMSIYLPYGLEYNLHRNGHLTAELLLPLAGPEVYAATPKAERAHKAIAVIRKLNEDLHHATGGRHARFLKEIMGRDGKQMVPKEKLAAIANTAMGDASQFYNPEDVDYNDAMMVLEHAYEGTHLDNKKVKKGGKGMKF